MTRRLLLAAGLAALLGFAPGPARAQEREDLLEPRPPWNFWSVPDDRTKQEIDDEVTNSFADLNKVVEAREKLVRRFGVLSAARLVDELRARRNESATWNAELTCWALRDRYGPARELWPALEPLAALLDEVEPYRRAFSALAIGCFHGPDTVPDERALETVAVVRDRAAQARALLRDIGRVLAAKLPEETHWHAQVAMALALAKRGDGPDGDARRAILSPPLWATTPSPRIEVRQAVLVALGLLPGPQDEDRYLGALGHEQAQIRRAAALGLALQLLNDKPPAWRVGVERVLRALKSDLVRPALEDGFEAVFARGVIAARANASLEWQPLLDIASSSGSKEEAATAAAQCLIFCPEAWMPRAAWERLGGGVVLHEPVVAAFLLIAGRSGAAEGVAACRDVLGNRAKRPIGSEKWDVRYHAAVGLLRALAAGALKDPAVRRDTVAALEAGVRRGLEAGEFRTRLERVLERQKAVLADPLVSLDESDVRFVEEGFDCPYGLMSHELEDMGLVRLNDLVPHLFNVHPQKAPVRPLGGGPVEPDKTEMPQRFLKACLDRYPYFRRIELRQSRGLRPAETMAGGEYEVRAVR